MTAPDPQTFDVVDTAHHGYEPSPPAPIVCAVPFVYAAHDEGEPMDAVTTRFPHWLQETVMRVAPGQRRSDAVRQLVIEAATEREFPMITWRDGPSGRRPGLRTGPDVEEVVVVARLHGRAPDPADVAAEIGISESAAADALRFAAVYPAIIDDRVAVRERAVASAPAID